MFLEQTIKRNQGLVETAFHLHRKGVLQPDSYIVDMDTLLDNGRKILKEANQSGIKLFFMLKQLGRNPYIARELINLGYTGAVVVDFKEARIMMDAGITIGNIGNLVQIPEAQMQEVVAYQPEVITVFSIDKIRSIDNAAGKTGRVQGILVRVYGDADVMYSGQIAGFHVRELPKLVETVKQECKHVTIKGVTSFPCYLYAEEKKNIVPTENLQTVLKAAEVLKECGIACELLNTPSATCFHTLQLMKQYGGNCGEPGHGLTGTTPMHAACHMEENPCVVYLSEVSHNFQGKGYCYGGGYYRRSHVKQVLVGKSLEDARRLEVTPPSAESIDYHFGVSEKCRVGETAIMAFRFQIFVTRSDVVLVKGIGKGKPEILGIYDSLGRRK